MSTPRRLHRFGKEETTFLRTVTADDTIPPIEGMFQAEAEGYEETNYYLKFASTDFVVTAHIYIWVEPEAFVTGSKASHPDFPILFVDPIPGIKDSTLLTVNSRGKKTALLLTKDSGTNMSVNIYFDGNNY